MTDMNVVVGELRDMFKRLGLPIMITYHTPDDGKNGIQAKCYGGVNELIPLVAAMIMTVAHSIHDSSNLPLDKATEMTYTALEDYTKNILHAKTVEDQEDPDKKST